MATLLESQIELLEELTQKDTIRELKQRLLTLERKTNKIERAEKESIKLLKRSKEQLADLRTQLKKNKAAYAPLKQTLEQTKIKLTASQVREGKLDRALLTISNIDSKNDDNKWNDQEWAIVKTKKLNTFKVIHLHEDFSFPMSVVDGNIEVITPKSPPRHVIDKVIKLAKETTWE